MSSNKNKLQLIDIALNLADDMFRGIYRGKPKHADDLLHMLNRAHEHHVTRIMATSTTLEDAQWHLNFISEHPSLPLEIYTTLGIHPTNALLFDAKSETAPAAEQHDGAHPLIESLKGLYDHHPLRERIVAIGEFGLDRDRLAFCPWETQLRAFEMQFSLAEHTKLPLFLHFREAAPEFQEIISRHRARFSTGVVHSFTGTLEEMRSILALDLYIGINGCSLKTAENLEVVKEIPVDRLMIETDAPWCDIRPSHAGYKHIQTHWKTQKMPDKYDPQYLVKGRNEPCRLIQVLEIIAAIKQIPIEELASQIYQNTCHVFFSSIN